MRRIDRYLIAEVLPPFGLGLLVYTFILLLQLIFRLAEMIVRRGVPATEVGRLLLFSMPNIVVITIPMAFLFGVLVAIGRLASESELTALRSSGCSLRRAYRPIFGLSVVVTLVTGVLSVWVLPRANHQLQRLSLEIATRSVSQQVEARVFYDEWPDLMLYVYDSPPSGSSWRGVFVAETGPQQKITVAEAGRVDLSAGGDRLVLDLESATVHETDREAPARYRMLRSQSAQRPLAEDSFFSSRTRVKTSKGLRELTLEELAERAEDPDANSQIRNLARVEWHKKFSIPVACIVFGLLGVALSGRAGRGAKSSGFALSIAIILVYWILISNGEEWARIGRMSPILAMWLPNLALGGLGWAMLVRRNADRSLLPAAVDRLLRKRKRLVKSTRRSRRERRPAAAQAAVDRGRAARGLRIPTIVLRIPRLRLRFPNLIDRYVGRQFGRDFLLVALSGLTVYIISDLSQNMDDILQNGTSREVVFDYYKYLSLQILFDIAPVLVLVTTLITFGLLSRSNEVTAAKALGVSLYRLSLPVILAALLVSMFAAFLQSEVLPASNERAAELKAQIRNRPLVRAQRRGDRQWLAGQGGRYIYNYSNYDKEARRLDQLNVFEFDDQFRLIRRLYAASAGHLDEDRWLFEDAWTRTFSDTEVTSYRTFDEPVVDRFPETPDYFEEEIRAPDQMNFGQLRSYIRDLEASGRAVPALEVQLHNKIAFPVISFIMALVGLPFAFRLGKQGALYGIGVAIVAGMAFLAVFAFCATLGEAGALPPPVAVWSPSILFAGLSMYLFLGVRT